MFCTGVFLRRNRESRAGGTAQSIPKRSSNAHILPAAAVSLEHSNLRTQREEQQLQHIQVSSYGPAVQPRCPQKITEQFPSCSQASTEPPCGKSAASASCVQRRQICSPNFVTLLFGSSGIPPGNALQAPASGFSRRLAGRSLQEAALGWAPAWVGTSLGDLENPTRRIRTRPAHPTYLVELFFFTAEAALTAQLA